MTPASETAWSPDQVKPLLLASLSELLDSTLASAPASSREAEESVWRLLLVLGRELLGSMLAMLCRQAFEVASAEEEVVRLRRDRDYCLTQSTTLGPVTVPLFAYRDANGKTHAPARKKVFPLHPEVRSSELLLQWEAQLGSQLPFRQAEEALAFFSHGAAEVEDTTIGRHLAAIGAVIGSRDTYRTVDDIARLLRDCATTDARTDRPLLYLSTDAHALRRYVDESFKPAWKMVNGIRMWCVHKDTGDVIHLGGEYTWGDCRAVAAAFERVVATLIPTGDAAPQTVFIADGMPWIRDHVVPVLPEDTVLVLDFFHVLEHLAEHARVRFGANSKAGKDWYRKARAALLGKRDYQRKKQMKRKGHKKGQRPTRRRKTVHLSDHQHGAGEAFARTLLAEGDLGAANDSHDALIHYIGVNSDRMDYPSYRQRGIQIGSGAMESLHRTASQMRLKLAGAKWLPETALAILNLRLMQLAGRWEDFWTGPEITQRLGHAFAGQSEQKAAA